MNETKFVTKKVLFGFEEYEPLVNSENDSYDPQECGGWQAVIYNDKGERK